MVTQGVVREDAMDDFRSTAFYLTLWYAVLTAIVSILLIALHDLGLASALLAAATLALLFALVLMARAERLTEKGMRRSQFWRTLSPQKRPTGEGALKLARRALTETWLGFAKGASAVAIALALLAYGSNGTSVATWAQAVQKSAPTKVASGNSY
jgi:prepilin signal peptidase PulO-like enzyme (type II secretory pathway)